MLKKPSLTYSQNVVAICGGTGGHTVLRGLTKYNYPNKNYAIVGVWDSGGSSGGLRVSDGILPPGDYMQVLWAMMEDEEQYQECFTILRDRSGGDPLVNLLATRSEKNHHGVIGGIEGLRNLFRINGHVLPVSTTDVDLCSETQNGKKLLHEHEIDMTKNDPKFKKNDKIGKIWLSNKAIASPEALKVIKNAEKIIITPGSPYSSIFPHLLVEGISEGIKSSKAKLIVIPNLMTTSGEDHHLNKFSEWLRVFQYYLGDADYIKHTGKSRVDFVIGNTNTVRGETEQIYKRKGQLPVVIDKVQCSKNAPGIKIITKDLASYDKYSHLFRHNPEKLAKAILEL